MYSVAYFTCARKKKQFIHRNISNFMGVLSPKKKKTFKNINTLVLQASVTVTLKTLANDMS